MPKLAHRKQRHNSAFMSVPPASPALLTLPTQRKVSEEDMHVTSTSFDSLDRLNGSASESGSDSSSDDQFSFSPGLSRMKRKGPSVCLVDLVAHTTSPTGVLSPSTDLSCPRGNSESPWGHFIDMLIPDDVSPGHGSFIPSCPSPFTMSRKQDPYPKVKSKRRKIMSPSSLRGCDEPLDGFFLKFPEVDEAADQLSAFSF